MRKMILAVGLASFAFTAAAQQHASPVGKWKTLDDQTGKAMTISEIYEAKNGTLAAKITENLGMAYSAGQFLLSAGTAGRRCALPHAKVLLQLLCAGAPGAAAAALPA